MSKSKPTLGDIYGDMLRGVSTIKESVKKGGNDLSDKVPAPLQDGGPQEKGGFHKSLDDAYASVYCNDEDEEMEDDEEECEDGCDCEKHDNDEDEESGPEFDPENGYFYPDSNNPDNYTVLGKRNGKWQVIQSAPYSDFNVDEKIEKFVNKNYPITGQIGESKKISKQRLNTNMKHTSTFDRLFKQINENFDNFGNEDAEDLDALGLGDAESDDEMGGDFGDEGEDDSVTLTLDRATAQTLMDMLQGVLGGEGEGDDLDFGDEGDDMDFGDEGDDMDFDEDEETETVGAKDSKGGGTQHKLQGRNNKVSGRPQPGSQSASHAVTDKVGNDGDYGHALHGAKQPNIGKNNKVSNVKQGQDFFR